MKATKSEPSKWSQYAWAVFWAERITVVKSTRMSPYQMIHRIELIFPFDLAEATYLVEPPDRVLTREDLIAYHARQLQKQDEDLRTIQKKILKVQYNSVKHFNLEHARRIVDYDH